MMTPVLIFVMMIHMICITSSTTITNINHVVYTGSKPLSALGFTSAAFLKNRPLPTYFQYQPGLHFQPLSTTSRKRFDVVKCSSRSPDEVQPDGDPIMSRFDEFSSIIVLSDMMNMFNMERGCWLWFSEDECSRRLSMLDQYVPRMQFMIKLVSKAIAFKNSEHTERILECGEVIATALADISSTRFPRWYTSGSQNLEIDPLAMQFFERFLMKEYQSLKSQVHKLYPQLTILDHVKMVTKAYEIQTQLLHLCILTIALKSCIFTKHQ